MNRKTMGQLITKEMKKRDLSFYRLAAEANITITQLKSITTGSANYTIESFFGICNYFEWDLKKMMPVEVKESVG